ncbi:MAG: CvpA family protein [Methylovulum sp.]|nr:CvpA family protein [Methylovulum sp.]
MIWVDYIIIGLLCITLLTGILKGFSLQAFSLVTWLMALLVSLNFSRDFSFFLQPTIGDPAARIAASFTILCLITRFIGGLISLLLRKLIKKPTLSIVDRLGGMVFGVANGAIFVTIIVMLCGLSVLPKSPWWKESKLIPPFQSIALWVRDNSPSELAKHLHYQ